MSIITVILQIVAAVLGVETTQKFPEPLSPEEERECFRRMREGDPTARDRLIEHNLRLVAHIVRKYYTENVPQDDLISVGTIGLVKAVDTFNSENGARFATYGAKCIQNEILMLFRSRKKLSCEVSLDDTIDVDKDGNPLTYIDVISTEDDVAEEIDRREKIGKAMECIRYRLEPRERKIVVMRYGLGRERAMTQREVADALGISRSYVSRLEKSAIEKIGKYLGVGT